MQTQCQGIAPALQVVCQIAAYDYYSGVFYGAWSAYQEAQTEACKMIGCAPTWQDGPA